MVCLYYGQMKVVSIAAASVQLSNMEGEFSLPYKENTMDGTENSRERTYQNLMYLQENLTVQYLCSKVVGSETTNCGQSSSKTLLFHWQ